MARSQAKWEAAAADPWLAEELPEIEWWGGQFDPAETDVEDPLVVELTSAFADVSGASPSIEGVPYGSDLRLLVREGGIPTALFGPGNVRRAHRVDESLPVADLVTATRTPVRCWKLAIILLVLVALSPGGFADRFRESPTTNRSGETPPCRNSLRSPSQL